MAYLVLPPKKNTNSAVDLPQKLGTFKALVFSNLFKISALNYD
tara:strand:+ start:58 stop:186 length:129 start_codon:yes stop_codon:yes gene_type:complete